MPSANFSTESSQIRFDTSLPLFLEHLLALSFSLEDVEHGVVLRDSSGCLAFIAREVLEPSRRNAASKDLRRRMGAYVRSEQRAVLDSSSPGVSSLLQERRIYDERVTLSDGSTLSVRLLDRRIVGDDWMNAPAPGWDTGGEQQPGRLVFASLKGGVGRTTCLAVLAVELSRLGKNVLAVDLDLEAPGLGAMMLQEDEKPLFGSLDWYVEAALGLADDPLVEQMVSSSRLRAGGGLIDVVPATGRASDSNPANVLAKLARAYLDAPSGSHSRPRTFLEQTGQLIDRLTLRERYDAVLVDARAGLNESSAAAILGLGADVLLFGVNAPQTFSDNRYLLAHLARFPRGEENDWLNRIKLVHAKASPDAAAQKAFRDRAFDGFDELLYRDTELVDEQGRTFTDREYSLDDEEAPHHAWVVLSDSNYAEFDPLADPRQITEEFYRRTYGDLLEHALDRLGVKS